MATYLTSEQAALHLGVSRQTLYAYVSRGLLRALPAENSRESRYLAKEVERLARQRSRGRKPKEIAKATLSWGLPILESAITLIEHGQLFYRGRNVIALASANTVETVAALLWQYPLPTAFVNSTPPAPSALGAKGVHRDGLHVARPGHGQNDLFVLD